MFATMLWPHTTALLWQSPVLNDNAIFNYPILQTMMLAVGYIDCG